MKTLENHRLLIDEDCPMCKWYSGKMEKHGLLSPDSCTSYQTSTDLLGYKVDSERAKNEIALYDSSLDKTYYGVESMIRILGNRWPLIQSVGEYRPVNQALKVLYKLISQNRKVIAPVEESKDHCVPSVSINYRIFYLVLVAILTGVVLNHYMAPVYAQFGVRFSFYGELFVCFGQVFWQYGLLRKRLAAKNLDYLGNMSSVSLIGGLLLIPVLVISPNAIFRLLYFSVVVGFMFFEHLRRCKLLGLGYLPTVSWVSYRLIILIGLIAYSYLS